MRLGLYSKVSRKRINKIKETIFNEGFKDTIEDIWRLRSEIIQSEDEAFLNIKSATDFYSLSQLREPPYRCRKVVNFECSCSILK